MENIVEENLALEAFNVTGVACAPGYDGTPNISKCTADNSPYTISGCYKIQSCVRMRDHPPGYDFSNVTEQLRYNHPHTFSVDGLKCMHRYEGTPVASQCHGNGEP